MTIDEIVARASRLSPLETTLRDALRPFVGDPTMEQILWGAMPDTATATITISLVHLRRAQAALSAADEVEKQRQKVGP